MIHGSLIAALCTIHALTTMSSHRSATPPRSVRRTADQNYNRRIIHNRYTEGKLIKKEGSTNSVIGKTTYSLASHRPQFVGEMISVSWTVVDGNDMNVVFSIVSYVRESSTRSVWWWWHQMRRDTDTYE